MSNNLESPDQGKASAKDGFNQECEPKSSKSSTQKFGRCGRIMKRAARETLMQVPGSHRLEWFRTPKNVLVIKKARNSAVIQPFISIIEWLVQGKQMTVWIESAVSKDPLVSQSKMFQSVKKKLITFEQGVDNLNDKIDFIICIGGDGTLLFASLLFQNSVPPVMAFHLDTHGFVTSFRFDNFEDKVSRVLEGDVALNLRSRLRCQIIRLTDLYKCPGKEENSQCENPRRFSLDRDKRQRLASSVKFPIAPINNLTTSIIVLNDVIVDRGPSPFICNLDIFLDGRYITTLLGDGVILSTPTGSTAYAFAAGSSMVHPIVPAIMVTPICPHSLSFRPIVVPAGVELGIALSAESRNTAWMAFDGRDRQELFEGDTLYIANSVYPVPCICSHDQIKDWFTSLAESLHWNVRRRRTRLESTSDLDEPQTENVFTTD